MFRDDGLRVLSDAVFLVEAGVEPSFDAAEVTFVEVFVAEARLVAEGTDVVELDGFLTIFER